MTTLNAQPATVTETTEGLRVDVVRPVLPPAYAVSGNDLWPIALPAEIERLNETTHYWFHDDDGSRCGSCDCRSGGAWSRFACRHGHGAIDAVSYEDFVAAGPHADHGYWPLITRPGTVWCRRCQINYTPEGR